MLGIIFYKKDKAPTEYIVALDFIPNTLNPSEAKTSTEVFIALQLYYPLIAIDDHGNLFSRFLNLDKTKSMDQKFNHYSFCLLNNLKFSNGESIRTTHVIDGIKRNKEIKDNIDEIKISTEDSNCFSLRLKKSDSVFLHKFHNLSSTPIVLGKDSFITGLGPYRTKEIKSSEINLEQTPNEKVGQFKNVKFILTKNVNEYIDKVFIDRNHVANQKSRKFDSPEMVYFRRPSQKTYVLLVNYENSDLAKVFVKCFPRESFIALQTKPLNPLPGFLPKGVVGSDVSWNELMKAVNRNDCEPRNVIPLTILHYEKANFNEVSSLLDSNKDSLPIPVIVKQVETSEMVKSIFNDKNFAALIGFDTSADEAVRKAEVMKYFQSFINEPRNKRLVSNVNKKLSSLFNKSFNASILTDLQAHVRSAHEELLTSGQIVPLGELDIVYEYPTKLENIVWLGNSSGINGYPDISKMEWNSSILDRLTIW